LQEVGSQLLVLHVAFEMGVVYSLENLLRFREIVSEVNALENIEGVQALEGDEYLRIVFELKYLLASEALAFVFI